MDGAVDFEALVAESPDDPIEAAVDLDDLCLLPHTSGTTGTPKGIMLTHGNVTWNVVNLLTCADFRSDDVTIAIAPFFRVGGTGVNVLPVLFMGGTVVVPRRHERRRDPAADRAASRDRGLRQPRPAGRSRPIRALAARRPVERPLRDHRRARPVPERLIRAYLDRGVTLLQGYGLSEAAPLALLLDPESALGKIGSAGQATPAGRRPDRGCRTAPTVRPGETGELLVRGPNVMAGYWNRPEATREVLSPDGWLRTGDAARSDDEGYIWIVDRVADRFLADGRARLPRRRRTGPAPPSVDRGRGRRARRVAWRRGRRRLRRGRRPDRR